MKGRRWSRSDVDLAVRFQVALQQVRSGVISWDCFRDEMVDMYGAGVGKDVTDFTRWTCTLVGSEASANAA